MSRCLALIVKFKLSRCFPNESLICQTISVSVLNFSTFSSWILLKKHYFGNFRNSLSALRNGIEDSVMSQFWPNKLLSMTQTVNFYRRTVTLRTKMSYVSHFIFWVGCKCTLSPEPSSSLENFKSWCRYIVCFNTSMEFSTVDLDTCLKSLFFLKGVNLFKQTTNLSCQSFLKYCFIPVSLLRCFWAYSNMKRFKRKGNYESLQK